MLLPGPVVEPVETEPGPSVDMMGELEEEEPGPAVVLELELVPLGLLVLLDELVPLGLLPVLVLPGLLALPDVLVLPGLTVVLLLDVLVLPDGELLVLLDIGPSDIAAVVVSLVSPPGLNCPLPELVV